MLFIFVATTFLSEAQDKELVGTWNIIECAYITNSGTEKIMEEQIKSGTAVTDYFIMEDGKYKMTSNMSGSGTLDTYEGTWKTSDNKLIMTLNINNQPMEIEWKYELKENILVLSRANPDGTLTIANTYRKK
jgi:hypothetical protein